MWGDHILVAPVLEPAAANRKIYLPSGEWWDFWTRQRTKTDQGVEITREVDLSTIPLYVRAGAIVPMGPIRQYATEPSDEPVTLQVYPGADGHFSWYQDDGISFAYQQRKFSRIDCSWHESARKLTMLRSGEGVQSAVTSVTVQTMDNGIRKKVTLTNHLIEVEC